MIEAIGWAGSALILAAFALVSAGQLEARTIRFQLVNAVGAVGLAVNGLAHRAWPVVALEGAWAAIAVVSLIDLVRRKG